MNAEQLMAERWMVRGSWFDVVKMNASGFSGVVAAVHPTVNEKDRVAVASLIAAAPRMLNLIEQSIKAIKEGGADAMLLADLEAIYKRATEGCTP